MGGQPVGLENFIRADPVVNRILITTPPVSPDLPRSAPWRLLRDTPRARAVALHAADRAMLHHDVGGAADAVVEANAAGDILRVFAVRA